MKGCEATGEYRKFRVRIGEATEKERIYPTHGCHAWPNPLLNRGSQGKIESYENKQDGEWEVASDEQTGYFNPITENKGDEREQFQHWPKNLFFGIGCL